MKSKEEIKEWLLNNCINEHGDLDIAYLDFSDFEGDIFIYGMKVKKDLVQGSQEVKGDLYQGKQQVQGDLFQNGQYVKGCLFQQNQTVEGFFITQTLNEDEEYKINKYGKNEIVKKTKQLTKEEIEELLGFKVEIIE